MLNPASLTLQHWLSPAFPTGAFVYSHGLEQVVARGEVTDADSLEIWLVDLLCFGTGWQDAVLLSLALGDPENLDLIDSIAVALQTCSERLREAQEQGGAFARTISQITGRDLPARCLPIALAEAALPLDLPRDVVIAAYLQAFLTNLATIAIRHVPLGQGAGHGVLARCLERVPDIAQNASLAQIEALGNSCLSADLAAMEHETKEVRLFRT